ncbi:hypothetical protein AB0L63_19410 [Nocardia sp. NPDC051990]|uniref:hypothetical protein n=1 Tax=Nocardia sp. NPDC051990 TaxID=3155285 RepID=UPI0034402EBF
MSGRVRAYGIVIWDRSGEQAPAEVATIREVARHAWLDLRAVSVVGSANLSVLLASFATSGIDVVIVPIVLRPTGWLDAVRRDCDVWTLSPPGYWPRIHASEVAGEFIASSGLC